jgi:integrase
MEHLAETGTRKGRRGWHYEGLRIHDLRHTAVALWIAAGASPNEIAKRAGHSSVVTVLDRYGHLLPGHEDSVTDALDAMATAARPLAPVVALG